MMGDVYKRTAAAVHSKKVSVMRYMRERFFLPKLPSFFLLSFY